MAGKTPARHVAILAGGSGTRFWPLARASRPKQLLPLDGSDPRPLLAAVYDRVAPLCDDGGPWVVASRSLGPAVRRLLPARARKRLVLEPVPRNTAGAVALAAHAVRCEAGEAPTVVVPSAHHVAPAAAWRKALATMAARAAASGRIVTLGLAPTFPATGFGWLEAGRVLARTGSGDVREVRRYVEKPRLAVARRFARSGRHLWNLGTFAFLPGVFLDAFARRFPVGAKALTPVLSTRSWRGRLAKAYPRVPATSVDYAVMEREPGLEVLATESFVWDDLGSLDAVARHAGADARGNALREGDVAVDARRCLATSDDGTPVALLGVEDLLVVRTKDATLVARRGRGEDVRKVVEALRAAGREDLLR
jgi:mannose-1-phosphate guanylyltransferase